MTFVGTLQTDRYLLGIRAVGVEGIRAVLGIVEVAVDIVALETIIVGVGVSTVAAAVDVAADGGVDTNGITAIDRTRDVVTAIHIVDIATTHEQAGRQLVGEAVAGKVRGRCVCAVHRRNDVGHTTATEDVLDD